jgi:dynactin-5
MLYEEKDYILTSQKSRISRDALIFGIERIRIKGKSIVKPDAVLRGDLASVYIGKYCVIEEGAVIRPHSKRSSKGFGYFPITLGDHVYVGESSIVEAASVGSSVVIGSRAVVGKRCQLRDGCHVLPDAVVAPETLVPPFTVFGGNPATMVCRLHDNITADFKAFTVQYYANFVTAAMKYKQERDKDALIRLQDHQQQQGKQQDQQGQQQQQQHNHQQQDRK